MNVLRDLTLRVRALVAPRRAERELNEELAFHLERETQKHLANGLDAAEARRRARARFGSVALAADACRDERRTGFFDTAMRDVSYALRAFRRAPFTALTIAFTVALGLGLVTAAFTFVDAYILRLDAVGDPHELFFVKRTFTANATGAWLPFTRPEYERLRMGGGVLTDAAGRISLGSTRVDGRLMRGTAVTGNFFQVLRSSAVLGRALIPSDSLGGGRRVIVLSHRGWKRLLASDPSAVGRTVRINGAPFEIAGVLPQDVRGLESAAPDYWVPIAFARELGATSPGLDDEIAFPVVVGRLKSGVSAKAAAAALTAWGVEAGLRMQPGLKAHQQARYISLEPAQRTLTRNVLNGRVGGLFTATFLAFGLVLVIGCANVANLLLARGVERQREIGIRMALGAARGRIVRQLLTESLLLSVAAAAGGFLISRLALMGALSVARAGAPGGLLDSVLSDPPAAGWRVGLFLAAGALVATASFGLLPALQGTRLALVLRTWRGELAGDSGPGRARHALIAMQVGASALLLISAAVFVRSAAAAAAVDHGVRTNDTVLVPITNEDVQRALLDDVRTHPMVAGVAASAPRFGVQSPVITVETLGDETAESHVRAAGSYQLVSTGYFDVLGLRVVKGRTFTRSESTPDSGVVVLSEWLMRRLFPGGDAVGRAVRVQVDDNAMDPGGIAPRALERAYTVIGVVRDPEWKFGGFTRSFAGVYVPMGPESAARELALQVRGDPDHVRLELLERLIRIDPALGDVVSLQSMFGVQEHLLRTGFQATIVVGVLALALTVSGLFGVLSYLVARRRTEIAVRMALGASARNVARLVLSQSLRPVGIGLLAGTALAGVLANGLMAILVPSDSSIATTVRPYDPVAYGAGILVVVAACVLAASLPALRAARIDPGTTLKQE